MDRKQLARTRQNPSELAAPVEMAPVVMPPVDVYESDEAVYVIADLPGVSKDEARVEVERGRLCLTAPRPVEGGKRYDYRRDVRIPENVDAEKISAQLADGVLRVHLPRVAKGKGRQITIRA